MSFFVMIVIWSAIALIKNLLRLHSTEFLASFASNLVNVCVLIFLYWLLLKALRNPGLFTGILSELQLVRSMVSETRNPASHLSTRESDQVHNLMVYMIEKKPYLDASLSINKLASLTKIPPKELSILINHKLNKHFYDFINEFRIKKAKEILADKSQNNLTILEILYQVGFNSKSSFNTLFKKYTGLTPTQYRRKH